MLIVNKVSIQPGPDTVKETRAPGFHLLLQSHGRVSAVGKVKLKCRAAECPSNGSLYLMEQRSVIRSESFYHN